jgi:hypothetical protein
MGAVFCKLYGNAFANAAGCTGNDGHFSFK